MDEVIGIAWGVFFLVLIVGWLSGGGGGSDFDTKDPGDFDIRLLVIAGSYA